MATRTARPTSMQEHKLLVEAATDFGNTGKTDKVCPRCGDSIILVDFGSVYAVRCATDGCIKAQFRGI